jgi:hypothetical protein
VAKGDVLGCFLSGVEIKGDGVITCEADLHTMDVSCS